MRTRAFPIVGVLLFCGVRVAALPASTTADDDFVCTEVIGVSVTGDWFGAGFEEGIDGDRWQVRWRKQAFLDQWVDPGGDLWTRPPQSACAARSENPDRVVFTGVHWEFKTREAWEEGLAAVVGTIRVKYSGVRRIELLTMLRGPGNRTCGSPMTVVEPYIDEAVERVVSRFPGLVFAGPRVEAPTCDVFTKGGPHFTDPGMADVARLYRGLLEPRSATVTSAAGKAQSGTAPAPASPNDVPTLAFPGQYAARAPEWKYPAWPRGCARFPGAERVDCLEFVAFDFGALARYAAANAALMPAKPSETRVVFYGDSITDNWSKPTYGGFFPGKPYVNRGIGGQTTSQMLLRFRADVLAATPKAVVILAGTNDIAGNAGPVALETVQGNLATMAELARLHGVRVVLASVLPIADDKKDAGGQPILRSGDRPPATIDALNRWLVEYARTNGHVYLDYFTALTDAGGRLKPEVNDDGLHPNAAGYAVMAPLAERAIALALAGGRQ
jgi:lysophospholipase L1-like esterase